MAPTVYNPPRGGRVNYERFGLEELQRRYHGALAWYEALGGRVEATRFAAYRDAIDRAVRAEAINDERHQSDPSFANSLAEATDLTDIAMLDASAFESTHAIQKLHELSSGPEAMRATGHDPARDYGFEFAVARMLQRHGSFGGFGEAGDVLQMPGGCPWECKRLGSLAQLESRFRKARKQLELARAQGAPPGIVAIDLSRPLRDRHGLLNAPDDVALMADTERFLAAYIQRYVMPATSQPLLGRDAVLGVFVRFTSIGRAGGVESIRRSTAWQLVTIHPAGTPNDLAFRESSLATGEIVDGDLAELDAAASSVFGEPSATTP